eukprot:15133798-Heterocapsa_arctica.AAC.1
MLEWQANRLFHGHLWVKHDSMRGGAVVLHYREKLQSGVDKTWELQTARRERDLPKEEGGECTGQFFG